MPTPLIRKEPPSTRITHVPAGTFRRRRDGGVCMAAVHAVDTVQVRDHPQLPRVVKSRRGYPIYSLLSNTLRYQLSRARPTPSQHSCRTARHACTSSPNWLLSRFWRRRWAATPPQSSGTPSTRPPSTLAMSPPSALNSSVCATPHGAVALTIGCRGRSRSTVTPTPSWPISTPSLMSPAAGEVRDNARLQRRLQPAQEGAPGHLPNHGPRQVCASLRCLCWRRFSSVAGIASG